MFILIFIKSAAHESLLSVFYFLFMGNTHGMILKVIEQKIHVYVAMYTDIYSVTQNWFASGWLL